MRALRRTRSRSTSLLLAVTCAPLRPAPVVVLALLAPAAPAGTIYVDASLTTGSDDGSSWDDAYQSAFGLQLALLDAAAGDRIFVAQGTYVAGTGEAHTFSLPDGVEVYGSFLGGESSPDERPPFGSAPSVLSGVLGAENAYHVVRAVGVGPESVLDGFVVTGGIADGDDLVDQRGAGMHCVDASLTVRNCRFVGNICWPIVVGEGGGVYAEGGAPTFLDCAFEDNYAFNGGGLSLVASAGTVDRCVVERNEAVSGGGLLVSAGSGVVLSNSVIALNMGFFTGGGSLDGDVHVSNCTVVGNRADHSIPVPGGLEVAEGVSVVNCIFWDNKRVPGHLEVSGAGSVTYSIVDGGHAGTGNKPSPPRFTDIEEGDYSLTLGSGAIDAGDNGGVPAGVTLDLASNARFHDEPCIQDEGAGTAPVVDMGAFEFPGAPILGTTYCSPAVPNSTGSGGVMKVAGSETVADDDLVLVALDLPPGNNVGYFIMGTGTNTFTPPGSVGPICVSPGLLRYLPGVNRTNERPGGFSRIVGTSGPVSANITAGSTWGFQAWHRDGASPSNLTDAVQVTFR